MLTFQHAEITNFILFAHYKKQERSQETAQLRIETYYSLYWRNVHDTEGTFALATYFVLWQVAAKMAITKSAKLKTREKQKYVLSEDPNMLEDIPISRKFLFCAYFFGKLQNKRGFKIKLKAFLESAIDFVLIHPFIWTLFANFYLEKFDLLCHIDVILIDSQFNIDSTRCCVFFKGYGFVKKIGKIGEIFFALCPDSIFEVFSVKYFSKVFLDTSSEVYFDQLFWSHEILFLVNCT